MGDPYSKECGLPQGDPLSMMMVALLMRTWVVKVKEAGVIPSLLVDDILIVADGEDMLRKFKEAMDMTHEYLVDMGGMVAVKKSVNFTNNDKARVWLRHHRWPRINEYIKVVSHFKYLGAQITATEKDARWGNEGEVY